MGDHRCPGFACPRCAPDACEREFRRLKNENVKLRSLICGAAPAHGPLNAACQEPSSLTKAATTLSQKVCLHRNGLKPANSDAGKSPTCVDCGAEVNPFAALIAVVQKDPNEGS